MHARTAAAITAALTLALTGCGGTGDSSDAKADPSVDYSAVEKAAGIPPKPDGATRQKLLAALAEASPGTVRYEGKAVEAARNQCGAINNRAKKLDWLAAQRFTYEDVVTSQDQGAEINTALKTLRFCEV